MQYKINQKKSKGFLWLQKRSYYKLFAFALFEGF